MCWHFVYHSHRFQLSRVMMVSVCLRATPLLITVSIFLSRPLVTVQKHCTIYRAWVKPVNFNTQRYMHVKVCVSCLHKTWCKLFKRLSSVVGNCGLRGAVNAYNGGKTHLVISRPWTCVILVNCVLTLGNYTMLVTIWAKRAGLNKQKRCTCQGTCYQSQRYAFLHSAPVCKRVILCCPFL